MTTPMQRAIEAFYTTPRCDVHALALSRWPNQVTMDPQCTRCCENGLRAALPHLLEAVVGEITDADLGHVWVSGTGYWHESRGNQMPHPIGPVLDHAGFGCCFRGPMRDRLLAALQQAAARLPEAP